MKTITIVLADDHTVVREGIRGILDMEPDLTVVGEADSGPQAIRMATQLRPDVVIMDIAMPLLNGLEACRQLRKTVPESRILILSAHADDAYVERSIQNGAAGFLLKQTSGNNLARAVRSIHAGKQVFSASILKRFRNQQISTSAARSIEKLPPLTRREMEVLQLIAEGRPNKESAALLKISIKTIEKHRTHLMKKLDIHDTAGLTRYAISAGVIESSVQNTISQDPSATSK